MGNNERFRRPCVTVPNYRPTVKRVLTVRTGLFLACRIINFNQVYPGIKARSRLSQPTVKRELTRDEEKPNSETGVERHINPLQRVPLHKENITDINPHTQVRKGEHY